MSARRSLLAAGLLASLLAGALLAAGAREEAPPRWVAYQPRSGPTPEEKEKARIRMGITVDQQQQIEALFTETGRQMRDTMGRVRDLYQQLDAVYNDYDYDRAKVRAIEHQIMQQRRRLLTIHASNETRLRAILNRDQFARMRAMIAEMRGQRRDGRWRGQGPKPPGT